MKFNKLVAAGLLAAILVSGAQFTSFYYVDAYEASAEEKAEKYRFLQESRAAAKEQKEQFMQKIIDEVGETDQNSVDKVDLQSYYDQLSEKHAVRVAEEKKQERQNLLDAIKKEHAQQGISFATPELAQQQQEQLISAINKASDSIESAAKTVDNSADRVKKEQTEIKSKEDKGATVDGAYEKHDDWTSDDLEEVAICQAAGYNVLNEESACDSTCRSYMAYTKVTSRASAQYALLNSADAYTDPDTGIRMYQGRYCIAVGQGYTKQIGTKIDLVLEDGTIWKCVLGECKAIKDTDNSTHTYCKWDGSVAEFIIDDAVFNKNTEHNPVNTVLGNYGKIMKVVVID